MINPGLYCYKGYMMSCGLNQQYRNIYETIDSHVDDERFRALAYALRCLRISNPWSTHLSQSALLEGAAGGCSLGGSQSIGHQSGSWVSASGEDSVNINCEVCRVALFFVLGRNIMTSHDISWSLKLRKSQLQDGGPNYNLVSNPVKLEISVDISITISITNRTESTYSFLPYSRGSATGPILCQVRRCFPNLQ